MPNCLSYIPEGTIRFLQGIDANCNPVYQDLQVNPIGSGGNQSGCDYDQGSPIKFGDRVIGSDCLSHELERSLVTGAISGIDTQSAKTSVVDGVVKVIVDPAYISSFIGVSNSSYANMTYLNNTLQVTVDPKKIVCDAIGLMSHTTSFAYGITKLVGNNCTTFTVSPQTISYNAQNYTLSISSGNGAVLPLSPSELAASLVTLSSGASASYGATQVFGKDGVFHILPSICSEIQSYPVGSDAVYGSTLVLGKDCQWHKLPSTAGGGGGGSVLYVGGSTTSTTVDVTGNIITANVVAGTGIKIDTNGVSIDPCSIPLAAYDTAFTVIGCDGNGNPVRFDIPAGGGGGGVTNRLTSAVYSPFSNTIEMEQLIGAPVVSNMPSQVIPVSLTQDYPSRLLTIGLSDGNFVTGNVDFPTPILNTTPSTSVSFIGTNGYNLTAQVIKSTDAQNMLTIRPNGLFVYSAMTQLSALPVGEQAYYGITEVLGRDGTWRLLPSILSGGGGGGAVSQTPLTVADTPSVRLIANGTDNHSLTAHLRIALEFTPIGQQPVLHNIASVMTASAFNTDGLYIPSSAHQLQGQYLQHLATGGTFNTLPLIQMGSDIVQTGAYRFGKLPNANETAVFYDVIEVSNAGNNTVKAALHLHPDATNALVKRADAGGIGLYVPTACDQIKPAAGAVINTGTTGSLFLSYENNGCVWKSLPTTSGGGIGAETPLTVLVNRFSPVILSAGGGNGHTGLTNDFKLENKSGLSVVTGNGLQAYVGAGGLKVDLWDSSSNYNADVLPSNTAPTSVKVLAAVEVNGQKRTMLIDPTSTQLPSCTTRTVNHGRMQVINDAGCQFKAPSPIKIKLASSALVDSSPKTIAFNTLIAGDVLDFNSNYNSSNGRFTAQVKGFYHFDVFAPVALYAVGVSQSNTKPTVALRMHTVYTNNANVIVDEPIKTLAAFDGYNADLPNFAYLSGSETIYLGVGDSIYFTIANSLILNVGSPKPVIVGGNASDANQCTTVGNTTTCNPIAAYVGASSLNQESTMSVYYVGV